MTQTAAAPVIDLDAFRRERQARTAPPRSAPPTAAPMCVIPVLVAWIPVWPVR